MRSHFSVAAVAGVALGAGLFTGATGAAVAPAAAAAGGVVSGGVWGNAEKVPGLAALDQGGSSDLRSVSCGSAGNCSAGGGYADPSGQGQAFVVNQRNGTWRTAQQVPGLAALNAGGSAEVYSVSCASAGNCSAGGFYHDSAGHHQAFVVSETNGVWGSAQEVPGTAALNAGGAAAVYSVSCAAAGKCSAGGYYHDGSGHQQAFVVNEANGTWGTAEQVPGTAALNQGGNSFTFSVSCSSAGNCSAGGFYFDSSRRQQAFVVNEANGTWGTAEQVPGTAALAPRGGSGLSSVSCAAAGNCSAGGGAGGHAFVVTETNGTWGTAQEIPGPPQPLSHGLPREIDSVSCASAGNCSAGGFYTFEMGATGVFVVNETNGTWGTAHEVPGTAALNQGENALLNSLSCGSAGNCSAGGYYQQGTILHPFVANQVNGTWRTAQEVPGIAALTHGLAILESVSCASAGNCSAGGNYAVNTSHQQAFVVSETT